MTTDPLEKAFAATRKVVANVTPDQYDGATPCASWNVRTLLNHIVEGANWFALCVSGGAAPDPDPTHGVDYAAGNPLASYDEGVAASLAAFGSPGALDRTIELPFGALPGSVFMGIATDDVVVHGWDLAKATGQPYDVDPALASHLLEHMKGFADALRGPDGEGAFGPAVDVGAEAPPIDQLVGYLGRQP